MSRPPKPRPKMSRKEAMVGIVTSSIFKSETINHDRKITEFISKNNELLGKHWSGFYYKHRKYAFAFATDSEITFLHNDLIPHLIEYHNHLDAMEKDMTAIHQALSSLFIPCRDDQDMRDALPESIVVHLPHDSPIALIYRRKPEMWPLLGYPEALRRFEKIRVKMDAYCASRLLY